MKIADPLGLKVKTPKTAVIFAASQLQGQRNVQEDYFLNFNDECFALADGVGADIAAETAIWGYKLIRQRHFYWQDKKLLMKRIFRSTNIALWQKKRETGFEKGLAATLEVLVIGDHTFWLGHIGGSSTWFFSGDDQTLKKITSDDEKVLGKERYGLTPQYVSGGFSPGDALVLVSDGVTNAVKLDEMEKIMTTSGDTSESLTKTVLLLLQKAQSVGGKDNMTAIIVKRIVNG